MTATMNPSSVAWPFVIQEMRRGFLLCCPHCECHNVHPAEVIVDQHGSRTKVTKGFTCVRQQDGRSKDAGVQISMDFWCEQGHAFEYTLDFRRDRVYVNLVSESFDAAEPRDEF